MQTDEMTIGWMILLLKSTPVALIIVIVGSALTRMSKPAGTTEFWRTTLTVNVEPTPPLNVKVVWEQLVTRLDRQTVPTGLELLAYVAVGPLRLGIATATIDNRNRIERRILRDKSATHSVVMIGAADNIYVGFFHDGS
jgi:hypothetical protein